MPRGGMVPGRRPSTGRPAKGGRQIGATRLGTEAANALDRLIAGWGVTRTAVIERALVEAARELGQ